MSISLVLFDIDGTLMITKGAGSRSLLNTGRAVFGDHFEWTEVTVGTLDTQIFEELARHNAIDNAAAYHDTFRVRYLSELAAEIKRNQHDVTVLPGMRQLVDKLSERARATGDIMLGILSGNFREAAHMKLRAAGFDLAAFPVQVYAEDGNDRVDLPRAAIQRASDLAGVPVLPQRTLVIGDTPRDISCAHSNGCDVLAVATGRYSVADLRSAGADRVVVNLEDAAPVVDWLDVT